MRQEVRYPGFKGSQALLNQNLCSNRALCMLLNRPPKAVDGLQYRHGRLIGVRVMVWDGSSEVIIAVAVGFALRRHPRLRLAFFVRYQNWESFEVCARALFLICFNLGALACASRHAAMRPCVPVVLSLSSMHA